jgi:2-polyprenyl-6-methoxyphenol hydroxylase-like FAD-dependent oxidoreductase
MGGLSAAIALGRIGADVAVFERASDIAHVQVGGGWALWPNAVRALDELGLGEATRAVSTPFEAAEFRSWRGKLFASWPVGELARKHGTSARLVTRVDLHRTLANAVEPGTIRVGARVVNFHESDGQVVVRLEDGTEEEGDALVGADGLRSVVRERLVGDVGVRYAGYTSWLGIGPAEGVDVTPAVFYTLFGRGARFIYNAVRGERVYWHAVRNAPEGAQDAEGSVKEQLLDEYRGWVEPVEAIVSGTAESSITRFDTYAAAPFTTWTGGRVALLGDAAHPITFDAGQGAAQAIEDSVVLARTLDGATDIPSALHAYALSRVERTASLQRLAVRLGKMGQVENRLGCAIRDGALRLLLPTVGLKSQERDTAAFTL